MSAIVTLKQGKSYRYKGLVFTSTPSEVTDKRLIEELRHIGALNVVIKQDGPPPPPPKPLKVKPETSEPEAGPATPDPSPAKSAAAKVKGAAKPSKKVEKK